MKYIYPLLFSTILFLRHDALAMNDNNNNTKYSDEDPIHQQRRKASEDFSKEVQEKSDVLLKAADSLLKDSEDNKLKAAIEKCKKEICSYRESTVKSTIATRDNKPVLPFYDPHFVDFVSFHFYRQEIINLATRYNKGSTEYIFFYKTFNYFNLIAQHLSDLQKFYLLNITPTKNSAPSDPSARTPMHINSKHLWERIIKLKTFSLSCIEATNVDKLDIPLNMKVYFNVCFKEMKEELNNICSDCPLQIDDIINSNNEENLQTFDSLVFENFDIVNSMTSFLCGHTGIELLSATKQLRWVYPLNFDFYNDDKKVKGRDKLTKDQIAPNIPIFDEMWKDIVWKSDDKSNTGISWLNHLEEIDNPQANLHEIKTYGQEFFTEFEASYQDVWKARKAVEKSPLNEKDKAIALNILKQSFDSMSKHGGAIKRDVNQGIITTRDDVNRITFIPYCKQYHLRKALHELLANKEYETIHDAVNKALDAMGVFERHFLHQNNFLIDNLEIKEGAKIDGIQRYCITFNPRKALVNLKIRARQLELIASSINLERLKLPDDYKAQIAGKQKLLRQELKNLLKNNEINKVMKAPLWKTLDVDLSGDLKGVTFGIPDMLITNEELIRNASIAFLNPLMITFVMNNNQIISLTKDQIEENLPLWDSMCLNFQDKKTAVTGNQKPSANKGKSKKKGRKKQVVIEKKKNNIVVPITTIVQQDEKPIVEQPSFEPVTAPNEQNLEKCDNPAPYNAKKQREELILWLRDILNTSKEKKELFIVYDRAHCLVRQLDHHPELFDTEESLSPLQDIAQRLCDQISHIQNKSKVIKKERIAVPFRALPLYLSFMESSVSDLVGIRFGRVRTLFESLGIKIDTSRAGSRVHFEYGNHATSIHIHDKHDEPLEGGRISSLRKFLWEIGFTTDDGDEEESN